MKTIFYYGLYDNKGGLERYALNLIKSIHKQNTEYKFHILTYCENFAYKEELIKNYSCSYTILPNPKTHPIRFYKKLKNILKDNNNSIVQLNIMSYRNFLLLNSIRKSKIKCVICGHSNLTARPSLLHIIFRKVFKNFGVKVALNSETAKFMFDKRADVKIINNAINPDDYTFSKTKREDIRNMLHIPKDSILIGQIGRVCKQKNQKFTIQLANYLNNNKYHFLLIGKILDRNQLVNIKYSKNVKILGEVNDISSYLSALDIYVMPSLFEGFSLALCEAVANGLNPICSNRIPKISEFANIKYLDLKLNDWVNNIENYIQPKERKNIVMNTCCDINSGWPLLYLKIYNGLI